MKISKFTSEIISGCGDFLIAFSRGNIILEQEKNYVF